MTIPTKDWRFARATPAAAITDLEAFCTAKGYLDAQGRAMLIDYDTTPGSKLLPPQRSFAHLRLDLVWYDRNPRTGAACLSARAMCEPLPGTSDQPVPISTAVLAQLESDLAAYFGATEGTAISGGSGDWA